MDTQRTSWITLTGLALALAAPIALNAADQDSPPGGHRKHGPGGPGGGFANVLTPDEQAKYKAARDKALADDPALAKEEEDLKGMREQVKAGTVTREDAMAKMKGHHEKMNAAMLKADPSVQPLIDKIQAAMKERFSKGGGPGGQPKQ